MSLPIFFKCGCAIRDEDNMASFVKIVFRRCKKHQKEMQFCSWETWAKINAPVQYKKYKKDTL
jgi:hypothetical protein